jgi:hypothetical protein
LPIVYFNCEKLVLLYTISNAFEVATAAGDPCCGGGTAASHANNVTALVSKIKMHSVYFYMIKH